MNTEESKPVAKISIPPMIGLIIVSIILVCVGIFGVYAFNRNSNTKDSIDDQKTNENSTESIMDNNANMEFVEVSLSSIEIANTSQQRQQGLQSRESLCADCGMLFDFGQQGNLSFWMKNTTIPLDMIFIDNQGIIVTIHENTIPLQLDPAYKSTSPAQYVLEVNAGFSKQNQLQVGARIDMPSLIDRSQEFDQTYL